MIAGAIHPATHIGTVALPSPTLNAHWPFIKT